ncbi:MAG: 3-methyl-2-oxobutanoate dehydrogenase subunit VorB [Candidatus Omnitrophica bacterium]|nr:3-methyl-2-oxobutanoate dehydrogenase subunit VorB [Candidatus Omnitrophota bacterium]
MANKKILISGNEAIAEGALAAGCSFYAGYPITPQNEIIAYMASQMPERGGVFVQAESELAAINMVFGASATGARAMTSSSSPGISLKQEGISYLAGAQLPAVIVNIMRAGPGLGNIWPAQSDYFQATRSGGHGDYHCIVLAFASVQEAYDMMQLAFDLADKYRNPVIILGDGLLGQMMEPIVAKRISPIVYRSNKQKKWALTGCKGRKPNIIRSLYMSQDALEKSNFSLQAKYQKIKKSEERYEGWFLDDAKIILVAHGSMARIAKGAVKALRDKGKRIGLIRPITLWPFPAKIFRQLVMENKKLTFLAVEMSFGQMVEDVRLSVNGKVPVKFFGRSGGAVLTAEEIIREVNKLE